MPRRLRNLIAQHSPQDVRGETEKSFPFLYHYEVYMFNYIGKEEFIHSAAMLWAAQLSYRKNIRDISEKTRISMKKLNAYRNGMSPIEKQHASSLNHFFRLGYGFFEQTATMKELTSFEKELLFLAERIVQHWDGTRPLPRRWEKIWEKLLYSEKSSTTVKDIKS